jgi:hypothetical protein
MRQTITTGNAYSQYFRQEKLDTFWDLIEDRYEEDWRVDQNGDVTLVVDDALLERILTENYYVAWYAFGTWSGSDKDGKKFLLDRPEFLKGTYVIKGIYAPDLSYVKGDYQTRTYFFIQEGF